jgi:cell division protein FtsL
MSKMRGWVLAFVVSIAGALVLGLSSVWLNIERMDLAYDLNKLEKELAARTALASKLELERNNLISPYRLKRLASLYGLVPVGPGQMRIMTGQDKKQDK